VRWSRSDFHVLCTTASGIGAHALTTRIATGSGNATVVTTVVGPAVGYAPPQIAMVWPLQVGLHAVTRGRGGGG
jgi:hypothetical protein